VRQGNVSLLREFGISPEEFAQWERLYDAGGNAALKATKLQEYRKEKRTSPPQLGSPTTSSTKIGGAHQTTPTRVSTGKRGTKTLIRRNSV
jgi:hypothetical protein